MKGLRKLRVDLDVPVFWRNSWREKEGEMLEWIGGLELEVPELTLGVFWDVKEGGKEMRERFGNGVENRGVEGEGKRKWKVERMERKGEEGNLWERDWGYLVDLGMSG
jgi:hypothetical protein